MHIIDYSKKQVAVQILFSYLTLVETDMVTGVLPMY